MSEILEGFTYTAAPARVVFGDQSLRHLDREVELLGACRPVVISTPGQLHHAQQLTRLLAGRAASVFARAVMHVPEKIVEEGRAFVQQQQSDVLIAYGGGSSIGLAKAIALTTGLPIIAIPTTYAGSEMTPVYGITSDEGKKTGKEARVIPRAVIYDPALSMALPVAISVTSALNAMAHAVEGLYAADRNPITDLMACEGIGAMAAAIPQIRRDPANVAARGQALYGAWLCGTVLGSVGMSLHHKLCHTLGGSFNLPHAEVHAVMLPYAVAFNAQAAPAAMLRIENAIGAQPGTNAASALQEIVRLNGAPVALRDIGMRESDLDRAALLTASTPYPNPRPVGPEAVDDLRELLQMAFEGSPL